MKTRRIELTKDQIDTLVCQDEKILRLKFEKDLASIRKKYEFVEIDIHQAPRMKQVGKTKLTDELFKQYLSQGMNVKSIAELTKYNEAYVYKIRKRIQSENLTQL
jgi:hypothetical protein